MQRAEVSDWIESHGAIFPKWKAWWEKTEGRNAEIVFEAWCEIFEHTTLSSAQAASKAMLAGTIKRPYQNEDHVSSIIQYAHSEESKHRAESRPEFTPQSTAETEAICEEYRQEKANGKGLLERYAAMIGLMPESSQPITVKELTRRAQAMRMTLAAELKRTNELAVP